jgi:hypothetical protein
MSPDLKNQISETERIMLRAHPGFLRNPFHLTADRLVQACETHLRNIDEIFRHNDRGLDAWKEIKDLKAKKLLSRKYPDQNDLLIKYLRQLKETTKLKPTGGILRKAETAEHYLERAAQKAARLGKLEQVKVE